MNKKFTLFLFALMASTFVMAQTAPVLHFKFSNNLNDSSSNYFTTASVGSVSYTDDRKSQINGGLICTSGGVKTNGASGAFKVNFPFTFATWVKPNNLTTVNPLFTSEDDQSVYSGIWVQILSDGTVAANVGNGGTPNASGRKSAVTNSPVITQMGSWYQIVVVANSISSFAIYVNGVLAPSTLSGSAGSMVYVNGNANNVAKVGTYTKGSVNNYYFDGVIDEMALWNVAIAGNELNDFLADGMINYTSVNTNEEVNFSLYPNPSNNNVSVVLPSEFDGTASTITIYNALGELVKQQVVSAAGTQNISVQDLAKGAYLVQVSNNVLSSKQTLIVF